MHFLLEFIFSLKLSLNTQTLHPGVRVGVRSPKFSNPGVRVPQKIRTSHPWERQSRILNYMVKWMSDLHAVWCSWQHVAVLSSSMLWWTWHTGLLMSEGPTSHRIVHMLVCLQHAPCWTVYESAPPDSAGNPTDRTLALLDHSGCASVSWLQSATDTLHLFILHYSTVWHCHTSNILNVKPILEALSSNFARGSNCAPLGVRLQSLRSHCPTFSFIKNLTSLDWLIKWIISFVYQYSVSCK